MISLRASLIRPPVVLAFGTSGLRGLVEDITDLEAYINARGFFEYLRAFGATEGRVAEDAVVALGGDLRPSTERIRQAVARAAQDCGLRPETLGAVPSPALAFYAMRRGWASVMITGSHIPFDRNGIKFNKPTGEVLKVDEGPILASVACTRAAVYDGPAETALFDERGMFKPGCSAAVSGGGAAVRAEYLERYSTVFPRGPLCGRRVVLYEHSSVGRDWLAELLVSLGVEVIRVGRSTEFIPIDTEDISPATLEKLRDHVRDAVRDRGVVDAVVSTDGDSDRPLVCAVETPAGGEPEVRFLGGDLLGLLAAVYLEADAVAVPVSANDAVDTVLGERGVDVVKTRIGSPHVIQAMTEFRAAHPEHTRVVAWEANGGFLTGTDLNMPHGVLTALPTRDAFLPILAVLHAAFGAPDAPGLLGLLEPLPRRFSKAGLIDNFPVDASRRIINRFRPPGDLVELWFRNGHCMQATRADGSRASSMDPACVSIAARLSAFLTADRGFGAVTRVNALDGIRVWCDSGDIIHLRPSGNAPQMRVYAVADTTERAAEIVAMGIREPDGLLRKLEHA